MNEITEMLMELAIFKETHRQFMQSPEVLQAWKLFKKRTGIDKDPSLRRRTRNEEDS